jgi:hypothetical protein
VMVSVWIPIIVAIIGILGVIGGQAVASSRDDRRWNREIAREETRTQRELQSAEASRQHELKIHWIDQRLSAYTECLSSFDEWLNILKQELVELRSADGDDELGRRNRHCRERVKAAVDQFHIIGSPDAVEAGLSTFHIFHGYHHRVNIIREPAWMPNEPEILRAKFENELIPAFRELRNHLRSDLGVEQINVRLSGRTDSASGENSTIQTNGE